MYFPVFIKNAFTDGEKDTFINKLLCFVGRAIESVDDPILPGLMLFMQSQDFVSAAHIVDDQGFFVLLRE